MYSGTTFSNLSGSLLGGHQKIDRIARKHLRTITNDAKGFPKIKDIIHFEGKNGPDGIKVKSPAKDEPWHYYDPFDEDDSRLIELIEGHYEQLVKELKKGSPERAAFDAAWLAHALVDGLTPAHHYPYEEELVELRGEGIESRTSYKEKVVMPGDTPRELIRNNWKFWGVGGLITAHVAFEMGVAFIIAPLWIKNAKPTDRELEEAVTIGYEEAFKRAARQVAILDMYNRFLKWGWSPRLIRDVRNHLAPIIIKTVTLVWFSAMREAGLLKGKK